MRHFIHLVVKGMQCVLFLLVKAGDFSILGLCDCSSSFLCAHIFVTVVLGDSCGM